VSCGVTILAPVSSPRKRRWSAEAPRRGGANSPRREPARARRSKHSAARGADPCRGAKREPCWPEGIVGSITIAAATARRGRPRRGVPDAGHDAEIDEALPAGSSDNVLRDEERIWLSRAPGGVHWGRVMFSAKEKRLQGVVSVDRAVARLRRRDRADRPAFRHVHRRAAGRSGIPGLNRFSGRFLVEDGLVGDRDRGAALVRLARPPAL